MSPHEWIATEWILAQAKPVEWRVEYLARLGAVLTTERAEEW